MNVAVVTGTRAEYGIWRSVLLAIQQAKGLRLQLVVTGMHLLGQFGMTVKDIEKDGWKIAARVPMYRSGEATEKSLARGIVGLGEAFAKLNPQVVLVLGDRLEILAAAQAAMTQHRMIGHVHGGEVAPGQFDEQIRHAVTKLAHVHFASTAKAGERIVRMGEDPKRVFVTGGPALDQAVAFAQHLPKLDWREKANPNGAVLVMHPTTPDEEREYRQAKMIWQTLRAGVRGPILLVGPNNDPGCGGIVRAWEEVAETEDTELRMSLPQEEFWRVINERGLLIGNSSSGIIEAATFRCAVINLGNRQDGRERSGNVLDVGITKNALVSALRRVLSDRSYRQKVALGRNIYGDGRAAERIVKALQKIAREKTTFSKRFYDA